MSIHKKLFNLQQEIGAIKKDSINPHFKNTYFDINTIIDNIKPLAKKHGLSILQPPQIIDGKNVLVTQITDIETDDFYKSFILLPDIQDPQKMGSAITYYRRYSLQSLLFLEAEDDDGNKASGHTPTKTIPNQIKGETINNNDLPF